MSPLPQLQKVIASEVYRRPNNKIEIKGLPGTDLEAIVQTGC